MLLGVSRALILPCLAFVGCLLASACKNEDDASNRTQSEASPEGDEGQKIPFFVELLHLPTYPFLSSGSIDLETEADAGASLGEFEFESPPDGRLSFVIARDPADGSFVGVAPEGLALFQDGVPIDEEQSNELRAYMLKAGDSGAFSVEETEAPEAGLGTLVIESTSESTFVARITGTSALGAGVFAVHRNSSGLFRTSSAPDEKAVSADLELVDFVSDGGSGAYLSTLERKSNFSSLIAPGLYVLFEDGEPLFTKGEPDRGEGLETLAEDGNPFPLVKALEDRLDIEAFPEAADAYVEDGSKEKESTSYSFFIFAAPGTRLALAGMLAQSNDVFVGTGPRGLPLFEDGEPIDGDYTRALSMWDVGTEVNERPGYGPHQATRQLEKNSGESESDPIDVVSDGYEYPPLRDLVQLTISAN